MYEKPNDWSSNNNEFNVKPNAKAMSTAKDSSKDKNKQDNKKVDFVKVKNTKNRKKQN
jgi:hypothetical protein